MKRSKLVSIFMANKRNMKALSFVLASGAFGNVYALESVVNLQTTCLLYTSPSPRDQRGSRMPSSA